MSYISVDDAIRQIGMLGPGIILAKINIQSAFRLIPVHPADGHLLAMEWKGSIYFDTSLPFSLRPVPKPFNVLADLLEWILVNQGATHLLHYLDDLLTLCPLGTLEWYQNLELLIQVCHMLEIPLDTKKLRVQPPV